VLRAIFFDFGGVIMRTEFQAPRQRLAERLNMEYEDLVRLVFESETSRKASIGAVTVNEHWAAVVKKLKRPASEAQIIRDEFFGGDVIDLELINTIRSLRGKYKIGLISNAWNDLRSFIAKEKFADIFDTMTISAEVGTVKPDAKIYQLALEQLQVPAEAALFVDDFAANIEGCEKVGMKGLLFKDPQEVKQKLNALI
jgi:epoxide hydrolase-like predicted phosphatase